MAQTIDNITIKVNVEGKAQVDQLDTSLKKTGETSGKVSKNFDDTTQGVRNFSYQIQDMAVQLEMGTDVMRVMGQQLPQMLGSFGTLGIIIGALAAVGLPLFSVAMRAAGVDMRSLKEHTDDLQDAVKSLHSAQELSSTGFSVLQRQYGESAGVVKDFYNVNLKAAEAIKRAELASTIAELKDQYGDLGHQLDLVAISQSDWTGEAVQGAAIYNTYQQLIAWWNGVNIEQAQMLGKELKNLNVNSKPEELVATITRIQENLLASADASSEMVLKLKPILDLLKGIAQATIDGEANMRAQAQAASQLAASMYNLEASFIPRIGASRRAYDQANAARLEGEMKIAAFRAQAEEKSKQDGISRAAEVAAFTNRTNAETRQRILDIAAAQKEAGRGAIMQADARERGLLLETQIATLQESMRGDMDYNRKYAEEVARASAARETTEEGISEQLRRQQITAADAQKLRNEAANAERLALGLAAQRRKNAQDELAIKQETYMIDLRNKTQGLQLDMQALELQLQNRTVYPEVIAFENKKNELTNANREAVAAVNREILLGNITRADGNARIEEMNKALGIAIDLEKRRTDELLRRKTGSSAEGAQDAIAKILAQGMSAYEMAGAGVEAVFNGMNSAIDNFVNTGKFKFGDFAKSVIADLVKIQMKAMVLQFLGALFPGLQPKLSIPGKAVGGPLMPRTAYMVGERGPELFVPNGAGNLVPNHQLGGSTQVTYNINAVDAQSFKAMVARDPEFIYSVTQMGAKRLPR